MRPSARRGRYAALPLAGLCPATSWAAGGPAPYWFAPALFGVGAIVVVWLLLKEALSGSAEERSRRDEARPELPRTSGEGNAEAAETTGDRRLV